MNKETKREKFTDLLTSAQLETRCLSGNSQISCLGSSKNCWMQPETWSNAGVGGRFLKLSGLLTSWSDWTWCPLKQQYAESGICTIWRLLQFLSANTNPRSLTICQTWRLMILKLLFKERKFHELLLIRSYSQQLISLISLSWTLGANLTLIINDYLL